MHDAAHAPHQTRLHSVSIPQLRVAHSVREPDSVLQLHDRHSACLQQASCAEECGHGIGCKSSIRYTAQTSMCSIGTFTSAARVLR